MVRTHSQTNRLPTTEILRIEQTCESGTVDGLELVNLGYLMLGEFDNSEYTPSIFNLKISSGETLYAMVFKPHNFKVGIMYPTILNVYGGPEVQVVSNSFKVSSKKNYSIIDYILKILNILGNATIKDAYVGLSRLLRDLCRFSRLSTSWCGV